MEVHADRDVLLQRLDGRRVVVVIGGRRDRAVEAEIGIFTMKVVTGRVAELGQRRGDSRQRLFITPPCVIEGRLWFNGEAELVAALDDGNGYDRR